jgi:hypothetical protein
LALKNVPGASANVLRGRLDNGRDCGLGRVASDGRKFSPILGSVRISLEFPNNVVRELAEEAHGDSE